MLSLHNMDQASPEKLTGFLAKVRHAVSTL
jgi:hypothetical protein